MLKIEWAVNTPSAYTIERKGDVVLIDYTEWMTLDKHIRTSLLKREHEEWVAEQARLPKLTANERKLADTLERMEDSAPTAYAGCEAELGEPFGAVNLDDEVDYKQAFEEAEVQLTAYRNIVTRMQEAWTASWSWASFGAEAKPLMAELLELLHREQNGVAPDNERMSVPDDDEDAEDTRPPKGAKPAKDTIIRAWDEEAQQVVYWQEKWSWGPNRETARRFTRVKALELANATNSVDTRNGIVNICAIQA